MGKNKNVNHNKNNAPAKHMEEDLEGLLLKALENIDVGIIIADLENKKILYQNEYAKQIFSKELSYNKLQLLLTLSPQEKGPGSQKSFKLGEQVIGYNVVYNSNQKISFIVRDITEKLRLKYIANAVNDMKNFGSIFSGVRHEIGNPINAIKTALSVLQKNLDRYSKEKINEYIERMLESINHAEFILKSFKTFNLYENIDLKKNNILEIVSRFIDLIYRDFSNSLNAVCVKEYASLTTYLGDLFDREDHPRFVVRPHDWDECRFVGDEAFNHMCFDDTLFVDR